jgi:hypothetical protein
MSFHVRPFMSSAGSDVFKFRAADESKHRNYCTLVAEALPCTSNPREIEY